MHVLARVSRSKTDGHGSFLEELVGVCALSLVLFALTFRTALPLGVAVMTDEDGLQSVMCQQIAYIEQSINDSDRSVPIQSSPSYQCAFCMVLCADQAPLLAFANYLMKPKFSHAIAVKFPPFIDLADARLVPSDNLGRDPPFA